MIKTFSSVPKYDDSARTTPAGTLHGEARSITAIVHEMQKHSPDTKILLLAVSPCGKAGSLVAGGDLYFNAKTYAQR